MKVRIHRGAHEIGGSCVEVEHDGARLVLDVGRPLNAARDDVIPLPPIVGFEANDPSLVGVVISHAHQDHWGLVGQLPADTPIYIGEATARILNEAAFWTTGLSLQPAGFLSHRVPFTIGPFEITPFLNDHSAFDAYSMIVRAGGRSLFYTGDIRGHGRKQGVFEELLRKPPTVIDVLLMEGTNIRPHADVETAPISETQVEEDCIATFKATKGLCLVSFSAQNIDRLVTVYRAAKRSGRTMVVDLYAASIARATGNANIPQPGEEWADVCVYVPRWQRVKVKEAKDFDRVAQIKPYRIYEEDLAAHPSKYVVMSGMASLPQFLRAGCLEDSTFVWSLWTGYLKDGSGKQLVEFLAEHNISMTIHHTSGHASIGDLQRLAKALNPKRVVPIHTFAGERYPEHFDHVESKDDGAWWDV